MSYEGHVPKRQRMDVDGRGGDYQDNYNVDPSPVVHVRGLSEIVIESDIINAVQHFGPVRPSTLKKTNAEAAAKINSRSLYVIMMPRRRQALVEFEDIKGAKACVNFAKGNQLYIAGQPAFFNFSTSQKIQRPEGDDFRLGNNVLLFTILNAHYPITVDVMHTICSPYGQVQRIVIFKKSGVQSMVEFESVESAKRAKQSLNGADIYSGCCTLKIEYAKPTKLNVVKNDNESWDYTVPHQEKTAPPNRPAPLLQDPRYNSQPTPYNDEYQQDSGMGRGGGPGAYSGGGGGYGDYSQGGYNQGYSPRGRGGGAAGYGSEPAGAYGGGRMGPSPSRRGGGYGDEGYGNQLLKEPYGEQMGGGDGTPESGAVLLCYGLNMEHMNCDRVFNLFCLFGNVIRVKFLKSKEGAAMVQMGDSRSCERAIYNLGGATMFDNKLTLHVSRQPFLQEVAQPFELPDGTPSFKDMQGNRNNRFMTAEQAAKNRIIGPTETLHYFNAPPHITREEIIKVFEDAGANTPAKVMQFPPKSDKSSSGLVEYNNRPDALAALVLTNHYPVPNSGGGSRPYILKMCFSQSTINERNK